MTYAPVQYMDRTKRYYEAQGFERPYMWANFDDTPFAELKRPVADSRLAVITTGALFDRQQSDPRFVDSGDVDELPKHLWANDLAWDKDATHLNDLGSYLPIQVLKDFVEEGKLGSLTQRFHSVPTEYSQRRTNEVDAPDILNRCREDSADIALLIPL